MLNLALAYQVALAVLEAAGNGAQAAAQALVETAVLATGAVGGWFWSGEGTGRHGETRLVPVAHAGAADVRCGDFFAHPPLTPSPCPESEGHTCIVLPFTGTGGLQLVFTSGDHPDPSLLTVLAPLVQRLGTVASLLPAGPYDARRAWLQEVIERAVVGIYVIQDDRLKFVNNRFAEIFGYTVEELEGRPYTELVAEEDRPLVTAKLLAEITGEEPVTAYGFRGCRKDGRPIYVEVMSSRTVYAGRPAIQGTLVDLTERWQKDLSLRTHVTEVDRVARRLKEINARLVKAQRLTARLARTDPLTKLANQRAFHKELQKACLNAMRTGSPLTVLVLDLDNFKEVNDRFGHQRGDSLLVQAADLLRAELRQKDLVARIGGDEFAVLLPGVDAAQATRVAERIRQRSREVLTAAIGVPVGFSVGLASACGEFADPDRLFRAADTAMYEDKRKKD
ncbi:MAG: diguanylate cyclase domain-containing protein [Desulfotomaculales bacterium]